MIQDNFIRPIELEHIAALCRALQARDAEDIHSNICIGNVPVLDTNAEPLGFIEMVDGEARFVPTGWREE